MTLLTLQTISLLRDTLTHILILASRRRRAYHLLTVLAVSSVCYPNACFASYPYVMPGPPYLPSPLNNNVPPFPPYNTHNNWNAGQFRPTTPESAYGPNLQPKDNFIYTIEQAREVYRRNYSQVYLPAIQSRLRQENKSFNSQDKWNFCLTEMNKIKEPFYVSPLREALKNLLSSGTTSQEEGNMMIDKHFATPEICQGL